MQWLSIAVVSLVLAGCMSTDTMTGTTADANAPFDGEHAMAYVRGLALKADGSPRYRMPGSPGQAEGAAYLWSQLAVAGWSRHWQNFTGQDYLALDRSMVASYGPGSAYCPAADEAALPSWRFSNLYAVRKGTTAGGPLLMLGAHWDSQMHSDADSNATRRGWPDPGANDGASGVGVLLELMRHLSAGPALPYDVGVLLIDGEDGFYDCYPIAGSLYFTQHPPAAVSRFILLDMVGDPDARFAKETFSTQSDPAMMEVLWRHGRAAGGVDLFTNVTTTIEDDHVAFIHAGIPSVDLIDAGRPTTFPPQWDTSGDTVDKLSSETLGVVGEALTRTLRDPALAPPWT
ncbi:MAG: M28 family peptidase [bacterium]